MKIPLALVLAAALAAPVLAQDQPSAPPTPPPTVPAAPAHPAPGRRGGHPYMHHARRALMNAKRQLQRAAPKYGGHRQKALDLIDQAIKQINEGIKYARQQRQRNEQHQGPPATPSSQGQ